MAQRAHHSLVTSIALGWVFAGLVGIGWTRVAVAQSGATPPAQIPGTRTEGPTAERQRLRAELQRVQAEIDRLKKSERGLRTDYQLRARMADAEALARRLTELDLVLKQRAVGQPAGPAAALSERIGQEPAVSPSDGPAELEAKADILADQSRRVKLQAGVLKTRIDQLRGRQELRRRARQLDNDPFAPLEGSKRRMVTVTSAASLSGAQAPTPTTDRGVIVSSPGGTATPPSGFTPIPPAVPTGGAAGPAASPSPTPLVQQHNVLDPTTAQVRKLEQEGPAASATDLESMQRAMTALLARAQHLDAQSSLLRARARAH